MKQLPFLLVVFGFLLTSANFFLVKTNAEDPEINLNLTEIVQFHGFKAEEHYAITEDGYILMLLRIISPKQIPNNTERRVVVLQHGLLDSAHCWVSNLRNNSLGFLMADAGYDVWLPNSRGTTYSRRHMHYPTNDLRFWDFTWDQMASYDLPASLYYVLNVTGVKQLYYGCHSQGCQIAIAQLNRDLALQARVRAQAYMAPVVFLQHVRGPFPKLASIVVKFNGILDWILGGEFLASTKLLKMLGENLCQKEALPAICKNVLFLMTGFDATNLNKTRLPVYLAHTPAGTSIKNMVHYCQAIMEPGFQEFDFGALGNLIKYHKLHPPTYNISQLTGPVAMYYGGADWLVTPPDSKLLLDQLGKACVHSKLLPEFNHLDFTWGLSTTKLVYQDLMAFFDKHS